MHAYVYREISLKYTTMLTSREQFLCIKQRFENVSFDWLKAMFHNCMENMERFTPLYAIAYVIMNSTENLRFDREDYFHVSVFYMGYFIKEIETFLFPLKNFIQPSPYTRNIPHNDCKFVQSQRLKIKMFSVIYIHKKQAFNTVS